MKSPTPEQLTIPEFGPEVEVISEGGLYNVQRSENPPSTFVREIMIIPPRLSFKSLEKILQKTEKEFQKIEELTGAQTVPHVWGIARGYSIYRPWQLPEGYRLLAGVAHITPYYDPSQGRKDHYKNLQDGVSRYNRSIRPYALSDIHVGQFTYGMLTMNSPGTEDHKYYLHDIEPKFRSVRLRIPEAI